MRALTAFPVLVLLAVPTTAADPCVSGVPVGQRPGPYSFLIATGPDRGELLCYVCEQEDKPTAIVFARTLSAPLGKLLAELDAAAADRSKAGFKAWMTQLAETADLDQLAEWSRDQGVKSLPVGVFEDTGGPPAYLLSDDADVTVLLFKDRKVIGNFAYRPGDLNDAAIKDVMKTLPRLFK